MLVSRELAVELKHIKAQLCRRPENRAEILATENADFREGWRRVEHIPCLTRSDSAFAHSKDYSPIGGAQRSCMRGVRRPP